MEGACWVVVVGGHMVAMNTGSQTRHRKLEKTRERIDRDASQFRRKSVSGLVERLELLTRESSILAPSLYNLLKACVWSVLLSLSLSLSVCLSVRPSVCLSVCLCLCLSLSLSRPLPSPTPSSRIKEEK